MSLSFDRVHTQDERRIYEIYNILKLSGEHMFEKERLTHWKKPYPINSIREDCNNKEVFLVKDLSTDSYVNTFQLEINLMISEEERIVTINKFATLPNAAGKGIGKKCIAFIEDYCRNRGISKLTLDVYDKSDNAIQFYKKRGFQIINSKPTRNFSVYIMEKII